MTKLLKTLLAVTALLATVASESHEQAPLAADDDEYVCTHPPYKVYLFSRSPLVIYLQDFLTPRERHHMLELAKNTFQHSEVASPNTNKTSHHLLPIRTSSSTPLPLTPLTRCIESRASQFQGLDTPASHIEPIQLVRYDRGEHYHFHTDWFLDPRHATPAQGGQRVSSFFGYVGVGDGITGGGTNFPVLDAPVDEAWCEFVDCDEEYERGVTFRPVEGNVIYWENMLEGVGDQRTLHAGLPVTSGWKVGMNIWTRQGPLAEEFKKGTEDAQKRSE